MQLFVCRRYWLYKGTDPVNAVLDPLTRNALEQLLITAQYDTEQGRIVASFLLSWWGAEKHCGFILTELWCLDHAIAQACVQLFSWLAVNPVRPCVLGFSLPFEALSRVWQDRL